MLPSYLKVRSEDADNTGFYYHDTKLVNVRVRHYDNGRMNCVARRLVGPKRRPVSYDNMEDAFARAIADAKDALTYVLPALLRD